MRIDFCFFDGVYSYLSALFVHIAPLALKQGVAVTGAVNQHGQRLPVGGINEKIEGYFGSCETVGLDGCQGVLIPRRNLRHLMLERHVVEAVSRGQFHRYTAEHASEGMELLTGMPFGEASPAGAYPPESILGQAQKTLRDYRYAIQQSGQHKRVRKPEPPR